MEHGKRREERGERREETLTFLHPPEVSSPLSTLSLARPSLAPGW